MAEFIEKDENGFYVFNEEKFFKSLPKGLKYYAVDQQNEKIYDLGKGVVERYNVTKQALILAVKTIRTMMSSGLWLGADTSNSTLEEYVQYFIEQSRKGER